jgi:carbon storage regulator
MAPGEMNLPNGRRHAHCFPRISIATRDGSGARDGPGHTLSMQGKEFSKMLVLSRKVGERIHVGDDIVLEIRRIAGNRVTLALDAPRHVRILRGELELAAREFRPRTSDSPAPRLAMPVPAHAPLLDQAPAAPVCRTCAT